MATARRLPLHRRLKRAAIPLLCFLSRIVYFAYMRLVLATGRLDASGLEFLEERQREGKDTILAMLHQDMGAAPMLFRSLRMASTIVNNGDAGDVLVSILDRCGISTLRGGSSHRASRRAPILRRLVAKARREKGRGFISVITPDGAYGPAGGCKPGIAMYAILAKTEICCLRISARPAWYLTTWDAAMVPLPFSRLRVDVEPPIRPPEKATRESLEALRIEIENHLHRMHHDWFASLGRPAIPELVRFNRTDDMLGESRT